MRILFTTRFAEERALYRLRHVCEDCAFHDEREDECAHGYPDREHRRAHYEAGTPEEIVFCKEFELR